MTFRAPGAQYDSAEFLAAIVSSSTDAILSKDLNGCITSWNAGAERIFGYTADEMLGQSVTKLFPKERLNEEPTILQRIKRGEHVEHYETVRKRKDGTLIDVSLNVSPIRNAAGEIVGASKVVRDVTDLKRAQERFEVTLASIGDAVISTDLDGRVAYMNVVAEHLTGWTSRDGLGEPLDAVLRMVDDGTGRPVPSPVLAALEQGTAVRLARHTLLIARDGTRIPIDDSAAPIRSGTGRLDGVVVVFRDIRAKREAELMASRLSAIVEGSDDAIVSKDLTGTVTSWNAGAQRVFGYTAEEMVGQSILKVIPPERQDEEPQIIARFQRGERVDHFETVRMRKDGTRIDVSLTVSPIRDEDGRVVGASKIARDITTLRAAQQTLERYARELEDRVRERTAQLERSIGDLEAFSYSLSHDLRAPLRAITGFCQVLSEDFGDQLGEANQYVQRITSAAGRMDVLIRDVLALARLSHEETLLIPVDADRIAHEIVAERMELQPPRALVEFVNPLPRVVAHEAALTQVLSNLLDNAVKFVEPGKQPHVRISASTTLGRARICVTDNGIGIEPEAQERLFNIFQRTATAESYRGTGLGLAIVRKAVERMHGAVGLESRGGRGSTFWVELPAVES